MQSRSTYALWGPILVAAALAGMGCQEVPETEENGEAALSGARPVWVSAEQTRYLYIECPGGGRDCSNPSKIYLLGSKGDSEPFGAMAQGTYEGCGPQAAANMYGWLTGRTMGVKHARDRWINTWDAWWDGDNIATTPQALREGMEKLIEWYLPHHDVRAYQGPRQNGNFIEPPEPLWKIKDRLKDGYPPIVLVQGGVHYQLITGYEAPDRLFVVDYARNRNDTNWPKAKVPHYDPRDPNIEGGYWTTYSDMGFNRMDKWGSWVPFGGYTAGAYVAIDEIRYNPPHSPGGSAGGEPSCEVGGSCGDNRTYTSTCDCVCSDSARSDCESRPDGTTYRWVLGSDCGCYQESNAD